MSWQRDGPDRYKKQKVSDDGAEFWSNVDDSDWPINGNAPSFIKNANDSNRNERSKYNLRKKVGWSSHKFTQSEQFGYERDFADQLKDDFASQAEEKEDWSSEASHSDACPESEDDSVNEFRPEEDVYSSDDDVVSLASENNTPPEEEQNTLQDQNTPEELDEKI